MSTALIGAYLFFSLEEEKSIAREHLQRDELIEVSRRVGLDQVEVTCKASEALGKVAPGASTAESLTADSMLQQFEALIKFDARALNEPLLFWRESWEQNPEAPSEALELIDPLLEEPPPQ